MAAAPKKKPTPKKAPAARKPARPAPEVVLAWKKVRVQVRTAYSAAGKPVYEVVPGQMYGALVIHKMPQQNFKGSHVRKGAKKVTFSNHWTVIHARSRDVAAQLIPGEQTAKAIAEMLMRDFPDLLDVEDPNVAIAANKVRASAAGVAIRKLLWASKNK